MGLEFYINAEGEIKSERFKDAYGRQFKSFFNRLMFPYDEDRAILEKDFDFRVFDRIDGYLYHTASDGKDLEERWGILVKQDLASGKNPYRSMQEYSDALADLAKRIQAGEVSPDGSKWHAELEARCPLKSYWDPDELKEMFKQFEDAIKKNFDKLPELSRTYYADVFKFDFEAIYTICDCVKETGQKVYARVG